MRTVARVTLVWLAGYLLFVVLDLVWISFAAGPMYTRVLGDALATGATMGLDRIAAALLTWALIVATLVGFAVTAGSGVRDAAARGACLGSALYGVFSLTNYAVLAAWTLGLVVTDVLWGAVVCAVVSTALVPLDRRLRGTAG